MTVDVFELAVLLILTLMLGVLIPVLLELKRFARATRRRVESTGPKLDRLVEDAQVSATQLKKVSEVFRGKEHELVRLRESITQAVEAFEKVEKGLRIGSAVGAAVAPAIATFLSSMNEDESATGPQHELGHDRDAQVRSAQPFETHQPTQHQTPQN